MKKQILVGVIHELTMGGAERMMVNILNYFSSEDEEVHLIIFKNIGTLKEQLNKNITIHDLEASSVKKSMPKCLLKLYDIQPDIVFSGIGHVNIALAPFIPMMKIFLPKTHWISRETNIVSMQNRASKYPKVFDWLYRNIYKNYDVIIAQSQDMKNDLEEHYPATSKKCVVINNPIDIKRVEVLSNEKSDYLFNSTKINLLSVGNLNARKRQYLLLESLVKLPKNYTVTLVGSGDEENRLKLLSEKLGITERLFFEGHKTNPYPYMKSADLFILTSKHEGFPNVLLEANALGLPIVAFACPGGITEIIEDGHNGFSVTNGDVDAMVSTIKKAAAYNFNKKEIVNTTRERYSHSIILEKYSKVFHEQ